MTAGELTPGSRRLRMAMRVPPRDAAFRRRLSSKCLFGRPDREDTTRMISEQFSQDRRRIIERFGFDIRTGAAYDEPKSNLYQVCDGSKNEIFSKSEGQSGIFTQAEFSIFMDEEDKENTPVKKMAKLCYGEVNSSPKRTRKEGTPPKRTNSKGSSPNGTPSKRAPLTPTRTPMTPTRATKTPSKRTPLTPSKWAPLTPRQLHMTDYWNVRKRSESTSSDKEN